MRDVLKIKWYMLLLGCKTFRRSKQRQNHLFILNVSLICSVYSRFPSLNPWPGDVSDFQFQMRNSLGRSFFLSKTSLCFCFLTVFLICSLSLISTYHLLHNQNPPQRNFIEVYLSRVLKQVHIPAFPRICCRSSPVPQNPWETRTTACINEKKGVFILRQKKLYDILSKCTSTNTYTVE